MTIHHLESQMIMFKKCQLDKFRRSKSMPRKLLQEIKGNFKISTQKEKFWAEVQGAMS
jgi:hypothetical protein